MSEGNNSSDQPHVLCAGLAVWDLNYALAAHPEADQKIRAKGLTGCGGGPASNAAVQVVRLGGKATFAGRVGNDGMGELISQDLQANGVNTAGLCWTHEPSSVATVLVKPDGQRTVIAPPPAMPVPAESIQIDTIKPSVVLVDGHEPELGEVLNAQAIERGIPVILDAGSLHDGTRRIWKEVNILAASEKFAKQVTGESEDLAIFTKLREKHTGRACIVTFGERGLIYAEADNEPTHLPAFAVKTVDSNGAGDAFHGALALAIARGYGLHDTCVYASAAGAMTVTRPGARTALPKTADLERLL